LILLKVATPTTRGKLSSWGSWAACPTLQSILPFRNSGLMILLMLLLFTWEEVAKLLTERFKDLNKLNFPMVVRFKAQSNFQLPQLPLNVLIDSKVVKIDPIIIILLR